MAESISAASAPIAIPPNPAIYEINTWVWLHDLSEQAGERVTLANVPAAVWDAIGALQVDRPPATFTTHACLLQPRVRARNTAPRLPAARQARYFGLPLEPAHASRRGACGQPARVRRVDSLAA